VSKFLLVIAIFIVCYLLLRNYARRSDAAPPSESATGEAASQGQSTRGQSKLGEDMVRCAICGVHLPTSEAVTSRGDFFCSKEHLQLAVRDRERG
jgi:uncharacterized protein